MSDPAEASDRPQTSRRVDYTRRVKHRCVHFCRCVTGWWEVSAKEFKHYLVQALIPLLITGMLGLVVLVMPGVPSLASLWPSNEEPTPAVVMEAMNDSNADPGLLELVEVSYVETDSLPKLDIKLRNTGDEVAFVKRVEFHVDKVWTLKWPSAGGAAPVTADYEVVLPTSGDPYIQPVPVSQSVDPNGVDRFTFTLMPDHPLSPFQDDVYLFHIVVVYDGDSKSVASEDLLYMLSYPSNGFRTFPGPDYFTTPVTDNLGKLYQQPVIEIAEVVRQIGEVEGVRNERLDVLIESLP